MTQYRQKLFFSSCFPSLSNCIFRDSIFSDKKSKVALSKKLTLKSGVFFKNGSTEFSMYWFSIACSLELQIYIFTPDTRLPVENQHSPIYVVNCHFIRHPHMLKVLSQWALLTHLYHILDFSNVVLYGPVLQKISKIRQVTVESSSFIK